MSLRKFDTHRDIRIDRVKCHHTYLKPKKVKGQGNIYSIQQMMANLYQKLKKLKKRNYQGLSS